MTDAKATTNPINELESLANTQVFVIRELEQKLADAKRVLDAYRSAIAHIEANSATK